MKNLLLGLLFVFNFSCNLSCQVDHLNNIEYGNDLEERLRNLGLGPQNAFEPGSLKDNHNDLDKRFLELKKYLEQLKEEEELKLRLASLTRDSYFEKNKDDFRNIDPEIQKKLDRLARK